MRHAFGAMGYQLYFNHHYGPSGLDIYVQSPFQAANSEPFAAESTAGSTAGSSASQPWDGL